VSSTPRAAFHSAPLCQLLLGISSGGTRWLDFLVGSLFLSGTATAVAKNYARAIL
jgi:hypothetical protein